jgi:hypothetical protein
MAGHSSSREQKPASVKGGGQAALETAAPRLGAGLYTLAGRGAAVAHVDALV